MCSARHFSSPSAISCIQTHNNNNNKFIRKFINSRWWENSGAIVSIGENIYFTFMHPDLNSMIWIVWFVCFYYSFEWLFSPFFDFLLHIFCVCVLMLIAVQREWERKLIRRQFNLQFYEYPNCIYTFYGRNFRVFRKSTSIWWCVFGERSLLMRSTIFRLLLCTIEAVYCVRLWLIRRRFLVVWFYRIN